MTTKRTLEIYAGQRFELSLPAVGIVSSGNGLRMHIRSSAGAAGVIAILTHDGDANVRAAFATDAVELTIGASISRAWIVGDRRVEWSYDLVRYSLTDEDDAEVLYRGAAVVYPLNSRPADVTQVAGYPSGDARYPRFDGPQTLTSGQKAQFLENVGLTGGTGNVVGPASATDSHIAAFDGTTGKLIKSGGYTVAGLLAAAREWSSISGKPSTFTPSTHASTHATGGGDALTAADIGAQATLVSGTNIKTINSTSLLGSGDIAVSASPAGSSGQPQYNNGGAFGAMSGVTWDAANGRIGWGTASPAAVVHAVADSAAEVPLIAQLSASATANGFEVRNSAGTVLWCVKSDGTILAPAGSQSAPSIQFGSASYGAFLRSGSLIDFVAGGQIQLEIGVGSVTIFGATQLGGAGTVTGFSKAQSDYTGSATLNQYAANSFRINTNNGATSDIALTWSDVNIQNYCENEFVVVAPYYLRVNAPSGHTIRYLGTVSASGGYIRSNQQGARIKLRKIKSGEIFVVEMLGTWTVDS